MTWDWWCVAAPTPTPFHCSSPTYTALIPPPCPLQGGALLHIQAEMGVSDMGASIIVGAAKLGATLGTFLGGALMLYYGRRPTIAMNSVFFMVGPLVMAASWNATGLVVGRTVVGLGIGISAVVVPSVSAPCGRVDMCVLCGYVATSAL